MIFRLRMLCDENDRFVREYEVPYSMNLLELHQFLCDDLGYDDQSMTSFFLSNDRWEKLREFTFLDMELENPEEPELTPIPMGSITLGQILHQNKDRLIYVFDPFGDRSMFIELTGAVKEEEGTEYPRVTVAEEEPPSQFDAGAASSQSIFEEAMDDFFDFDGEDSYDEEFY